MPSGLYTNFFVWLYYYRLMQRARAEGSPDLYFLRYEDVVARPQEEFARLLAFLGLPYEPAVAQGSGNREGIPEREYAWKGRALEPITTARVGLFRRELGPDQVGVLERLGKYALPSLGYPLQTGGTMPLTLGRVLKLACGLARLAYRLPWHCLLNELYGSPVLCPPGPRPATRPTPLPAAGADGVTEAPPRVAALTAAGLGPCLA